MNTNEALPMVSSVSVIPEPAASAMSIWTSKTERDPKPVTRDDLVEMGKREALKLATDEIWLSLNTLFLPDQIVELRALDVTTPEKRMPHIDSGYYDVDHHDLLIERALWLQRSAQAKGVYVTLQDLRPALLARRANRSAPAKETTADHDIARYRWLPVDLDMHPSVRPSGVSSSPEQWTQIHAAAARLSAVLTELGWPQPVYADSGNGAHLLWRVDLFPGDAGLVSRVLNTLHVRTKDIDPDVDVDIKTYNPARIWKLYGTLACKGDHMPFAPHRLSRIVEAPQNPTVLTVEQLEDVCARWGRAETPAKSRKPASPASSMIKPPTGGSWSIEGWAAKVGLELPEPQTFHSHTGPGQKWNLKPCPCDRKCADGAAIQQAGDGVISFRCHHNTCDVRSWSDLRTLLGDPKQDPKSAPRHAQGIFEPRAKQVSEESQNHQKSISAWEKALREWFDTFLKEGATSALTAAKFADLLQPLIQAWEHLPKKELSVDTVLVGLPTISPDHWRMWLRRTERLFRTASLRSKPHPIQTDDDRASVLLRSASGNDAQVNIELNVLEEPWRVAWAWVQRSTEETKSSRVAIFMEVLHQTKRWLNYQAVQDVFELSSASGLDTEAIQKMLPNSSHVRTNAKNDHDKAKKKQKTKHAKEYHQSEDLVRALDVLPNAPIGPDIVIPEHYLIQDRAVGQMTIKLHSDGNNEEVFEEHLPVAILIISYQRTEVGTEWLTLAWPRFGSWQTMIVERSVICDRSKIVRVLSDRGAPVNSTNATRVINWLTAYEKANIYMLPMGQASTHMGWQQSDGFLLGDAWIDEEGAHHVDAKDPQTWRAGSWAITTTCAVDREDIQAFSNQAGTFEGWTNVVKNVVDKPRVLLAFYASLTAPMIFLLGGRTPIVDWSGPAGSGKTSVLRLAASVWGNPCEFRGQVIGGWNSTVVGIERRASFLGHLPLILNDTNKAPSWLPGKMIYELAESTGKQRGDIKGGRLDLTSWATIVLSSGESRLLDFAKASDAGTTHRVLSIHGSPWGNTKCSQEVHALRDGLEIHHGHAGRLFVQWITAHKAAHLEEWKARRQRVHQMLRAQVQDQTALSRLAEDLAAILVTAELAHEALNLPWSVQKAHQMITEVLGTMMDNSECYTAHQKAFVSLWEWCWSNQDAFWGRRKVTAPPSQGWIGRWDDKEHWDELYVLSSVVDKHLESLGYKPLSIRKEWVDAGFIRRGEGRNLLPSVRIDGTKVRCFALLRKAIEEQCNLENDAAQPVTDSIT